ncbi:MAG TPA: GNAT family N-acetyltransferase, partial [Chitinophagaceae bacterium]
MIFRHLTPMLGSSQMNSTLEFYTTVLGFSVFEKWEDDGILRWFSLNKDNTWIMFSWREQVNESSTHCVDLYFYPSDVESLWQQLKDRPEIVDPICDTDYSMREFSIRDNNGYVLRFGKSLQPVNEFDRWFPSNLVLESSRVQLRILRQADLKTLQPLADSETTWKFFTKDLKSEESFNNWINESLQEFGLQKRVPFVIVDKLNGKPAGSSSYGNISFFDKRLEVGWSWLGDEFKGSGVNTHAKYLLLKYALETLQFERVEINTDNLNERAKAALVKVGATPEGVLRNHMQMHSNR